MSAARVTVVRGGGVIGDPGEGILAVTRRLGLGGCAFDASDDVASACYAAYSAGAALGTYSDKNTLGVTDALPVSESDGEGGFTPFRMTIGNLFGGLVGLGMVGGLTLGASAGTMPYTTAPYTYGETVLTATARSLLDDPSTAAMRATLGLSIGSDVQAFDATLQSIAALGTGGDRIAYTTGVDTWAETPLTAFARTVVDDVDAPTMRATLGVRIGTDVQAYDAELSAIAGLNSAANKLPYFTGAGTAAVADFTAFARTLVDDADAPTMRTTLGVAIGADVQAYDAELSALAGLVSATNKLPYFTGAGTAAVADFTAFARTLVDDVDAPTMRTTLGLGIGADVQAYNATLAGIASTGITTAMFAANVVDTDVTLAANSNTRIAPQAAVRSFVTAQIAALVASSPAALDTLKELADALGDDANFATTTATSLGNRLRVDAAQGLSGAQQTQGRANLGVVIDTNVLAYDAGIHSLAAFPTAADKLAYSTAVDTWAETPFTAFARTVVDDTDAPTMRATLGVRIGTDVQAYNATLASIAALGTAADKIAYTTALNTWAETPLTAFARTLVGAADAPTMRTTLGLQVGTDVMAYTTNLVGSSLGLGGGTAPAGITFSSAPTSYAGIGTLTFTGGGANTPIVGTGTKFTYQLKPGDTITVTTTAGVETKPVVAAITDTTTTTATFTGNATGASFTITPANDSLLVTQSGKLLMGGGSGFFAGTYIALLPTITLTGAGAQNGATNPLILSSPTLTTDGTANINLGGVQSIVTVNRTNSGPTAASGTQGQLVVGATNTGNWTTALGVSASMSGVTGSFTAVSGATGTITYGAGLKGYVSLSAPGLTVTTAYSGTFAQQSAGTLTNGVGLGNYAVQGTNKTYLAMSNTNGDIPASGNYCIWDNTGYNSFYSGLLLLGSQTSLGSYQLQVTGKSIFTDAITGTTFTGSTGTVSQTASVGSGTSTNNSASGSGTYFVHTPSYTIPANALTTNSVYRVTAMFQTVAGSAPPTISIQLRAGTTVLTTSAPAVTANLSGVSVLTFLVFGLGTPNVSATVNAGFQTQSNTSTAANAVNTTPQPVTLDTTSAQALQIATQWATAGTGTNTISLLSFMVEKVN